MMSEPPKRQPSSPAVRRWKIGVVLACFVVAVSATIPWFDTPDTIRYRHLAGVHASKAAECRRLAQLARSTGLLDDATQFDRSTTNFERFAAIYSRESQARLNWLTYLISDRQLPSRLVPGAGTMRKGSGRRHR